MKSSINWKVFFILWIAALLSTLAVLPYSLSLQSSILAQVDLPLGALIAAQVVQAVLLFTVAIFVGLFLARRVSLGVPVLEAWTRGERVADRIRAILPLSVLTGVVGTLIVLALEFFVFQPALARELGSATNALNLRTSQPPAWMGFLASFYGGIGEEVLLRLFLMTFLVWLGGFVSRTREGKPTSAVMWTAILLAAILFGLGHLPAVMSLVPLSPLVVARTVVLNGLLGILLGWLYWKRGLEAAMISHFSADLVLHVLLAL